MVASGDVSMVTVVILNQSQKPVERFAFELGKPEGIDKLVAVVWKLFLYIDFPKVKRKCQASSLTKIEKLMLE